MGSIAGVIAGHPDQEFTAFIVRGIWEGFQIGFDPNHTLVSACKKVEGPSACLTFLGIEIDTLAGVLQLPRAKLIRIHHTLHRWQGQRTCQQRESESLIGLLQHACQVVHPG